MQHLGPVSQQGNDQEERESRIGYVNYCQGKTAQLIIEAEPVASH
jgi:hypothetical protein